MPILRIFVEPLPGVIVPMLAPAAAQLGVDPIHCAMIVISNLMLGMIATPVGGLLSLACDVAGVPPSANPACRRKASCRCC